MKNLDSRLKLKLRQKQKQPSVNKPSKMQQPRLQLKKWKKLRPKRRNQLPRKLK